MLPTHPTVAPANPATHPPTSGPGHDAITLTSSGLLPTAPNGNFNPMHDLSPGQLWYHFTASLQVSFSIPHNTEVIGSTVVCTFLHLLCDIIFEDFFSHVCAHMEINPTGASLGYKFNGDPAQAAPYNLTNEEQLRQAIKKAIEKLKRARSWEVFIEVHNL